MVNLPDPVAWMSQAECEIAVVGEENQAISLVVQPPDRIEDRPLFGEQIAYLPAAVWIGPGRDISGGLVQGDIELALRLDRHPIHRDGVVERVDLAAHFPNNPAVYRHSPGP